MWVTKAMESTVTWKWIKAVEENHRVILFRDQDSTHCFVPKAIFDSTDDATAFLATARDLHAKGSAGNASD